MPVAGVSCGGWLSWEGDAMRSVEERLLSGREGEEVTMGIRSEESWTF